MHCEGAGVVGVGGEVWLEWVERCGWSGWRGVVGVGGEVWLEWVERCGVV